MTEKSLRNFHHREPYSSLVYTVIAVRQSIMIGFPIFLKIMKMSAHDVGFGIFFRNAWNFANGGQVSCVSVAEVAHIQRVGRSRRIQLCVRRLIRLRLAAISAADFWVALLFYWLVVIMTAMQVLPVLDLLHGIVVRGVGGRRNEYRPVESRLVVQPDALSVARAFRDRLGLTRLYIADLDGILHRQPNLDIYRTLSQEGFDLLVDAGLRSVESSEPILAAGATQLIAGLETWPGPNELAGLCKSAGLSKLKGPERVIFSLDLKNGNALGDLLPWNTADPYQIGCRAVEAGVAEMIVLDLAQVGVNTGITTFDLCRRLLARFADLRVITGGGVRDVSDLLRLQEAGVDSVLAASSLHDGRIGRAELDSIAVQKNR